MRAALIAAAVFWASATSAGVFPSPGPGTPRYGQGLCSSLPAISATPVSAASSDDLATKLSEACGAGPGILELASGTYTDINLELGTGGVTIGGECEIRAANPASKPLLRAGVDVNRSVIVIDAVSHRIRLTNLACDGRRADQTAAAMTSVCPDTTPADGICDDLDQSATNRGCVDSRRSTGGANSTCIYGFEATESTWDAIFLRNQENSVVEASTVTGAGCDDTTCPALSLPADATINSVNLVGRGINFVDSANVMAVGNTVSDVTKQGLQCYGSTDCVLIDNEVDEWGISGITMLGSSGVILRADIDGTVQTWAQNTTTTNIGQGIAVTDGGLGNDFRVAIRDSVVTNPWGNGIAVEMAVGTPPEPEVILEGNTVTGPCTTSTHPNGAGLLLGDGVDDVERIVSTNNTVVNSACAAAVRVRNAVSYVGTDTTVSGTTTGDGVVYETSVVSETGLTTNGDVDIDAGSSGTMTGCTLNGGAVVNDASAGAMVRTSGC